MGRRSLIAVAVSLAMVAVVLNVVHPAASEVLTSGHSWGGYGADSANAVDIDSSGNVYIAGTYWEESSFGQRGFLAKFASDGTLTWNVGIVDGGQSTSVRDMAIDADGNAYLIAFSDFPILMKVSSTGSIVFAEQLQSFASPYRVACNPATGGVVVIGDRTGYGDGVIASFSSTGSELWARAYNGSDLSSPWGVAIGSSGDIYVVFDRHLGDNVGVMEFSSQGSLLRQVVLATEPEPEYSWDIAVNPAGDVYVLGFEIEGMHTLVARLTPTLAPVWTEYLVSPNSWQECYRLVVAQDGSIYALGNGATSYGNYTDAVSFHVGSDGTLIGSSMYINSESSHLTFNDATISSTGSVVIAGSCYGSPIMVSIPIPDVTTVTPSGTWVNDNTTWTGYSVSPTPVSLELNAPTAVVDNYDTSYGEQAWFGRATAPELNASIEYKISAQNPSVFYFRGYATGGQKPYSYLWTFGDGTSETNKRITHAYSEPGQYPVTLIVTDKEGRLGVASVLARVYGPPIIDSVYYSQPVFANTNVTFYVEAHDPDGGEIASYAWDFGDGTSSVSGDRSIVHFYRAAGSFLLDLTVTDDEGATASYQEMVVVLERPNLLPYATFSYWPTPFVGTLVTFDATSSYDPDGWIVAYEWYFGDWYNATGPVVYHTFTAAGTYYVTLWVTDNSGATVSWVGNVTVYTQSQPKNWTFLVYLDADNDLEAVGSIDFVEMSQVGSDANINIVVEMDRSPYYDYSYGDWTSTKRFYVTPWMYPYGYNALEDLGEKNMGDVQTLTDFLVWGISAYPADNFALILWDHGGGWDGAVCWDETNNYDALTLDEIEIALSEAQNMTGSRINLLGFDACLMGMVEVAYEVIEYVDVIAFSEDDVPWDGMPYNTILWDLKGNPTMSPADLGNVIVSRYMEYYSNESMGNPYVTMSSMDISASSPLYQSLELFSNELRLAVPTEQSQMMSCLYYTESFAIADYVDLYHFAQLIGDNTTSQALRDAANGVMSAIESTLTSEGHGFMHPNAHGLSIFFPLVNSSYLGNYRAALDFASMFSWDEFLVEVLSAMDDQYEPDNDYLQAHTIVHGETQIHSIGNGGLDVDWLVFQVTDPSIEVRVNTSGPPGVFTDTELRLYDVYGVPYWYIAYDDDSGGNGWSTIQLFLSQGTYYVSVTSYMMGFEIPWYGVSLYIGDIPNLPPIVDFDFWPYDPGVGTQVSFYGYWWDPDGYIVQITWDFGDGTVNTSMNYTTHAYDAPGNYTVRLTVVDDDGATSTASKTVYVVMNVVPVAVMSFYPSLPDPYDTVYFDGSGSYDPDGWIQYYLWDFGDGYSYGSYGYYAYHYYYQGGLYLATLTVTDNRGATNSTSVWVHVNMPPIAVIVPSAETGKVGKTVTFDGSGSYDPEGLAIVEYSWYFSDGGNETGPVVTHTFWALGYCMVSLHVRDISGDWGYSSLSFAVVSAVPPAAIIAYSPANPLVGQDVTFDGGASVDPDGSVVTYIWQLGDGVVATGEKVVHVYAAPGAYEIQLTVIDEDNLVDKSLAKITIASVPVAGFEYSPALPMVGQEVSFYAVGSYDPTGITLYVWSFGDGTYAQGWQASHAFATAGDNIVKLTVTNAMGVQTTISKVVSVGSVLLAPDVSAESSASDLLWDEPAEPGIGLYMFVFGVLALAIGCVVGDAAVCIGLNRKGT